MAEPLPVVEPAVADDLPRLIEIEEQAFDPALYHRMSARQFRRHLGSARAVLLVARAEPGGPAMGYALGFAKRNVRHLRFYSLAVDPEAQGGRCGAALFAALEQAAADRRLAGMQLEVRADNRRLLNRYLGLGYRPYRTVADYYPDGQSCIKLKRDFAVGEPLP